MTDWNLGSAVLILGSIYLYFAYQMDVWITVGLSALGLASWGFIGFHKERRRLFAAQIKFYEAKARFYDEKAKP